MNLANAEQTYYEFGNVEYAYDLIQQGIHIQNHDDLQAQLDDLTQKVDKEYPEWVIKDKYLTKVLMGIPFIGMEETDMNKTSIGTASSVQQRIVSENGVSVNQTVYEYETKGDLVCQAICSDHVVVDVMDYRYHLELKKSSSSSKKKDTSGYSYHKSNSNSYADDFYELNQYDDAEDFYYDNEDEFDSYEDAEAYWEDAEN